MDEDHSVLSKEQLDEIYVSEELFEIPYKSVVFKGKEIDGGIYGEILQRCYTISTSGKVSLDQVLYAKELIKHAIVEPKNIEIEKLRLPVLLLLADEIETKLGLSELAEKNLHRPLKVPRTPTQSPTSGK